ncbi:NADP-dependent oxidoreductase [Streptomyces sp. H10-C2]|uniref:NADP-dependent oxidoreductase n=1 Tax=unclassified Streptomyces TaxID=2593676 RepID=UPI0024BA94E0|nr:MULTISPECIES: NADP-dependent oxidoreductase [unclassified Streptomyces]MDJ0341471.1 NADP-dependent oxidoreductase [Streptomyces sp. PH10-H1]MDJ0369128.1 NADP-dependent oxidoreductase [Streptomyces sp. H10-C2]
MTKAIAFTAFGDADVLRPTDIEVPAPGPGQVRLAVRAAGVNPLDFKIRSGWMTEVFPVRLPHVPGLEASGTVEAVGEGVTGLAVGDEVFGPVNGAYAEQLVAGADRLAVKPASLSWEEAAALPVAGETAWRALELLNLTAGETLLIHGAAGGVGTLAVQFAVARGARVIGTASEAGHEYLRSLGAIPVTYGEGLAERVRALTDGRVDAVLDASGRDVLGVSVELAGGPERVVTIADAPGAPAHQVRFSGGGPGEDRTADALANALALHAAGSLRLRIHRTYPLGDAAEAHRASEHGHLTGKIVLTVA